MKKAFFKVSVVSFIIFIIGFSYHLSFASSQISPPAQGGEATQGAFFPCYGIFHYEAPHEPCNNPRSRLLANTHPESGNQGKGGINPTDKYTK